MSLVIGKGFCRQNLLLTPMIHLYILMGTKRFREPGKFQKKVCFLNLMTPQKASAKDAEVFAIRGLGVQKKS